MRVKLKTNKGAAKRFKPTAHGFKHRRANRNHLLLAKTQKSKRHARANNAVKRCDIRAIKRQLPNL